MQFISNPYHAFKKRITQGKNKFIYRFIGWYFLANTIVFWLLGESYLHSILSNNSLFENSMVGCSSFKGKCLVCLFAVMNYASYMMTLAFIPAFIVFLLAFCIPRKRLIFFLSVLLAWISVVWLAIDSRVFNMYKFHLNNTMLSFMLSPRWRELFDFSISEVLLLMSMAFLLLMLEIGIARMIWKKIIVAERCKIGKTIAYTWFTGVIFSYLILTMSIANNNNLFSQQIPNLPLYSKLMVHLIPDNNAEDILVRFSEQNFSQPPFPTANFHYPLHPMHCESPKKPYNIVFIMVDSLRFDNIQAKYMPHVTEFAKTSWEFQHHLSGGNATQPGLFSLFYSISSNYWTAALKQKKRPVFFELLEKYGYHTRIIWSAEMEIPPFDKTIYLGLSNLHTKGFPGNGPGSWDRAATREATEFLTSKQLKKPFFLHLFYDAPHGFCSYQDFPQPFQPANRYCTRLVMSNDDDPAPLYNRYLNAVKFVDGEIGKILDVLKKQGYLENTIVLFTSDHGQEFNENHQNYWGHSANFTDEEVRVPMLVYWPKEKPKKFNYVTSSYDVMPTLLTQLFSCQNSISDYSIGQSLLHNDDRLAFILAGSYINMGIIEPDRLTTLETSGRINITDNHAQPLSTARPRREIIQQALVLLRKYF